MRSLLACSLLVACTPSTIGPAAVSRGGETIGRAAYAGRIDAILNGVPTVGWLLYLSPTAIDGRSCGDVTIGNFSTKIAIYTDQLGSDLPVLPAGAFDLSSQPVSHVPDMTRGVYTDIDPAWQLPTGTLTLSQPAHSELVGELAGSAANNGTSADLSGTFSAPLCDGLDVQVSRSGP